MNQIDFVRTTLTSLSREQFYQLKDILADEFIPLSIIKKEELTVSALAEKLCDYFEKVELKTNRSFDKTLEKYANDIDSIVKNRIAQQPKQRKNKQTQPTPRARKYYEEACYIKENNAKPIQGLFDYSRIMFCLYMSIIKNERKEIKDFEYTLKSLSLKEVIKAMREETNLLKKPKFETDDPYKSDRSTFIITAVMFQYMKSKEMEGEY